MNILTIGGATQDIFIWYEDAQTMHLHTKREKQSFLLLKEGGKVEVKNMFYSTGGGAHNAAISFKRLGFSVSTIIKIGSDEQGTFILKKLQEEGIATDHVIIGQGQTGISFVIPSLEGDRTILAYRGINGTLTTDEIPFDDLANYQYLYITSLSGNSSKILLPLVQKAKQYNIPVATNPGTSQLAAGASLLRESLPYIDILILNSTEAKTFMLSLVQTSTSLKSTLIDQKKQSPHHHRPSLLGQPMSIEDIWFGLNSFFQAVLSYGPRIVVVTNGAEGVYVATHDTIFFHPSLPIKVVNTLGAGDAFGSSFVASLAAGLSIEQAIRHGIVNSASVIGYMDTKQGLLGMEELKTRAASLDQKLLQRFSLKE